MEGTFIVFPNDFQALDAASDSAGLIASFDLSALKKYVEEQGKEFKVIEVAIEGISFWVALRGFIIFDPPQKSHSPGSAAIYLARSKDAMRGLLLQYLPPHSKTSHHFHEDPIREGYHALAGKAALMTSRGEMLLAGHRTHVVTPHVTHQVRTEVDAALTLLEIIGSPNGLDGLNHNYVAEQ